MITVGNNAIPIQEIPACRLQGRRWSRLRDVWKRVHIRALAENQKRRQARPAHRHASVGLFASEAMQAMRIRWGAASGAEAIQLFAHHSYQSKCSRKALEGLVHPQPAVMPEMSRRGLVNHQNIQAADCPGAPNTRIEASPI